MQHYTRVCSSGYYWLRATNWCFLQYAPFKAVVDSLATKYVQENLQDYNYVRGGIPTGERRILFTKWIGQAWEEVSANKEMVVHSFQKWGISVPILLMDPKMISSLDPSIISMWLTSTAFQTTKLGMMMRMCVNLMKKVIHLKKMKILIMMSTEPTWIRSVENNCAIVYGIMLSPSRRWVRAVRGNNIYFTKFVSVTFLNSDNLNTNYLMISFLYNYLIIDVIITS